MDNIQLNKVKISVTELDSFILKSRKDLQKAKINKNKFLRKQAKLAKREEKEKATEKIKPVTSFLKAGAQKITSKVMPIFDTAMNFFGTLLLGFLVNQLPKIIENVSNFIDQVKPALDIAGKIFGVIGTGFGFIFDQLFPTYAKSKVDLNPIESELKTLDKDLNVGISELDLDNGVDEVTTRNADDPNVMSDGSVIRVGDTVGGSDFNPPAPVRQQPLMRNRGGVVPPKSKTSDSKKSNIKTTSGSFPKKSYSMFAKSLGKTKRSIEIFRKNIKNLQGMFKKSAPGTGGFLTRKPSPSGDNVEISSGPIQPGGSLDFIGHGDGATGKLVLNDATGKKIGSWEAISGVLRTGNTSQGDRANISGALNPLPDGRYPLLDFQRHGYIDGVGTWSAYINNLSGSIGNRSQLLVHSDIGSNGTAGCIGVELGGSSGTPAEEKFIAAYEAVKPTSVNVAIGKGAKISSVKPRVSPDNISVPTDDGGSDQVIIMPVEVEKIIKVPTGGGLNSSASGGSSGSNSSNLNNIP
jgi:hypothetical protein